MHGLEGYAHLSEQALPESACHCLQMAEPERAGAPVSAATFDLPADFVRVRLEVELIPPRARSPTFV